MSKEKISFLAVAALFIGAMVAVFIWAVPSIGYMIANDPVFTIFGFLFIAAAGAAFYVALENFDNPNYDVVRKIMIVAAIAATAVFGMYHAQHKADKADKIVYEVHN